jgi:hypothetical protein
MLSDAILKAAAAHPLEMPITCGRYLNREAYLEKALFIPFGVGREEKLKAALGEVAAYIERMAREAITMTTTPQQTTATPKPGAPTISPALAKVEELQNEVAYLRDLIIRQHAELKAIIAAMAEARKFDQIHRDELRHAVDRIIAMITPKADDLRRPAPLSGYVPAAPPDTVTILAAQIKAVPNKKGDGEIIHLLGGQFSTFGVPVYPEFYEGMGIELDGETPTYNGKPIGIKPAPFGKKVIVEMRTNGDKVPKPYRVIGLA